MLKHLKRRKVLLLLLGSAIFIPVGISGVIPWPNTGIWRHYFSPEDLTRPDIEQSLQQLRCLHEPKVFQIEALEVSRKFASTGVEGLPYFLKLAGQQRFALLIPTHQMVMPAGVIRPCLDSAFRIIHEIRDPRAIPHFKKMLTDDNIRLRAIAKSVLSEMHAEDK